MNNITVEIEYDNWVPTTEGDTTGWWVAIYSGSVCVAYTPFTNKPTKNQVRRYKQQVVNKENSRWVRRTTR